MINQIIIAQCPCSGGGPGIHPLVLLALVAGTWVLVRWIKNTWRKDGLSFMNKFGKIAIVLVLIVVVAGIMIKKSYEKADQGSAVAAPSALAEKPSVAGNPAGVPVAALPKLIDLGADKCIPCKMMAPILEELKKTYAGKMEVEFIDVWKNPDAGKVYGIQIIPTQIFFDAAGKELFRHQGFFSREDILAKWKEMGIDLSTTANALPAFERWQPAKLDERPKHQICYMCDGDINPKTAMVVKTEKGDVRLCSPHCYSIMYSCLTEDKTGFEEKVSVTDWASGKLVPAVSASYLYGLDSQSGRPMISAFADKEAAEKERQASGGNVIAWAALQVKELSHRCGFCDRACYPEDASEVRLEGIQTWGCCSHCALGVAARTGKDIEVRERDRLTGAPVIVKTLNGSIASLEPATAVAWFGQRKNAEGKAVSAGCFHQGFFTSADNLKKWVEQHPYETGQLISINQALADKMKLTSQQIQKACKIGECTPK